MRVVTNKSYFGAFARDAQRVFEELQGSESPTDSLLRDIHTFKANAGFFGFRRSQEAAHELEDYI